MKKYKFPPLECKFAKGLVQQESGASLAPVEFTFEILCILQASKYPEKKQQKTCIIAESAITKNYKNPETYMN